MQGTKNMFMIGQAQISDICSICGAIMCDAHLKRDSKTGEPIGWTKTS